MFEDKTEKIAIIGLGFVGLPLAMLFVSKGFEVIGIDLDEKKLLSIQQGKSYISDVSDTILQKAVQSKQFKATSNYDDIKHVNSIIICVPTPLNEDKSPNLNYVTKAAVSIKKRLKPNHLVILESSTYPGTTKDIVRPILEESGLIAGKEFNLAYSPERVDPGNKEFELVNTPKVVGGLTKECKDRAITLYSQIYNKVVPVSSTEAAEFTKLLENTYRFINISFMNEMAILCENLGVNIWEVIGAASTKPYGFQPFYPGPGISGHCIPVDPLYLQFVMDKNGNPSQFIHLSDELNTRIVEFIVQRTIALTNKENPSVLIYGLTYKKDIPDTRDSRAIDIYKQLKQGGAKVSYHDPFVPKILINGEENESVPLSARVIEENDIVLILTDHSTIPADLIEQHAKMIFDTRAVYNTTKKNIRQLGNGTYTN